ncbi:MAG TPA: hypothetical protein VJI74_01570 [Candidatus Paceibacterota bacterium]
MCKASIVAKTTTKAVEGETYGIGKSNHGLGTAHPLGKTTADCVVCVQNDTMLTLIGIPTELRQQLQVRSQETARFVDTGDNAQDLIELHDGRRIPFVVFADKGIVACVGVPKDDSIGEQQKKLVAA